MLDMRATEGDVGTVSIEAKCPACQEILTVVISVRAGGKNDGCRCTFCGAVHNVKLQDDQGYPWLKLTLRPALPLGASASA